MNSWLYFKLYPADPRQATDVITQVLPPVIDAYSTELRRWFFLRYLDQVGVHIRFRLLLPIDAADRLAAEQPALLTRMVALPARAPDGAESLPAGPGAPQVRLAVYEPELAKWGGPSALPAAEQVFQSSSAVALRVLGEVGPTATDRIAAGRLVVDRVLGGLDLPGPARVDFLRTHFQWWSGGVPETAARLTREAGERAETVAARHRVLADNDALVAALDEFVAALRSALLARRPEQKPLYLVFHHLHLMLNRLGVTPPEEAQVSLLSRPAA